MSSSKIEVEVEVKSSAEKIWDSMTEFVTLFPKAFPDVYQSVEVLQGDGKSAGSTRLIKYAPELQMITTTTEKLEAVDPEKKIQSYSIIDGDLLKFYKSFKATITVSPKDEGSLVKYEAEIEKASEEIPEPDLFKEFVVKNFKDLDAYLLKA
ncbi:MLP family protein [Acinetobacter baumannii]